MFENAGAKLKKLAIVFFVICLIAGAVAGNALAGVIAAFEGYGPGAYLGSPLLTIVGAVVGLIIGWLKSIVLYAFGELCENVNIIARRSADSTPNQSYTPKRSYLDGSSQG